MSKDSTRVLDVLSFNRLLDYGVLTVFLAAASAAHAEPDSRWDGLHVGVNAGYGWNNDQGSQTCNNAGACPSLVTGFSTHVAASGFIGGAQIGFNRQFDWLVMGLEADMQGAGVYGSKFTNSSTTLSVLGHEFVAGESFQATQQVDWLGTVRGLFGVSLWDRALVYATGGLAYGGVKANSQYTVPSGISFSGNASDTPTGWVAGGGVEYAVSDSFSAKIEGLYYDLGRIQVRESSNTPVGLLGPSSFNKSFDINGPLLRVGLNYRF